MSVLRSLILAAADSPRLQRFVTRYGFRLGASRFVAGETLDDAVLVLRRLNENGLLTNTTLLGEGVRDEAETARRRRNVPRGTRPHPDRGPADEPRGQAHAARPLDRRGARAPERRRARRPRRGARQLRPDRHGGVATRRRDPSHLPPSPRERPRERRRRAPVVPVPQRGRPRRAPAARTEPSDREGRVPRAAGDRIPEEERRRRRLRAPRGEPRSAARASPRSRRTTRA